jgi:hypothetical protein
MKRRLGWIGPIVAALLAGAPLAHAGDGPVASDGQQAQPMAQLACGERTEVVRTLRDAFGERQVAHGLANTGVLAGLFTGPPGTWTLVATSPAGISCMIGSGESWQSTLTSESSF